MKNTTKTLFKALCCALVLAVWATLLSGFASGAEKLAFKDTVTASAAYDDGGYYVMDGTGITVTATSAGGIEIEGNGYCTWAFYKDVIDSFPYLVYTVPQDEGNGLQGISATSYYAGGYLIEIPSEPGTHVIDLKEKFADQADVTVGYYYVIIYASGSAKTTVSEIYLSSADPTATPADSGTGEITPQTSDVLSIAVSVMIAASAAVVLATKKH